MRKTTKFITETGIMMAILIVMQFVTKGFGQLVTGSVVNLILAVSAITIGIPSGAIIAVVSPFIAFIFSIGTPFLVIVPVISLGNLIYVLILGKLFEKSEILAVVMGAISKFLVLYILITKVILSFIAIPEDKIDLIRISFSYPQLFTALLGGVIAMLVVKYIKRGTKWGK